ncbi:hypothetical protein [Bradyrhizobium sp. RT9a]|uniref:hypothetical protein n=1 Tax=Bradyrhizobium sp. RT9a TaxID=3156384 RepID=UPI00339B7D84
MALMDQNLVLSSAQAITATAQSTNAYDILNGNTLAVATGAYTTNAIIGNATVFGEDLGLGRGKGTPQIEVFSGAGTPITATSLDIQLQGAPDAGTGNTSGVTYVAYIGTEAIPLASILASNRLARFDFPQRRVGAALPRFIALNYVVAGANFGGLTVNAYVNLGGTSAQSTLGNYAANF